MGPFWLKQRWGAGRSKNNFDRLDESVKVLISRREVSVKSGINWKTEVATEEWAVWTSDFRSGTVLHFGNYGKGESVLVAVVERRKYFLWRAQETQVSQVGRWNELRWKRRLSTLGDMEDSEKAVNDSIGRKGGQLSITDQNGEGRRMWKWQWRK